MRLPHLGIHSKYEICNGSRNFEDYIEKAKFLGVKCLGVCDKNTLGGTLSFQESCKNAGIKHVLGESVTVKRKEEYYEIKLYVKNKQGWKNLLRINKAIKIDNSGYVEESELISRSSGIICVLTVDSIKFFNRAYFYKFKGAFKEIYFQLDATEWHSNERDKIYLLNLKSYLKNLYPQLKPVLIQDSYYLDKEESHIKRKLNLIGERQDEYLSNDQYFKAEEEIRKQLSKVISNKDNKFNTLFQEAYSNTLELSKKCNFDIPMGKLNLPKYKMTKEESEKYENVKDLFDGLIEEGLKKKKLHFPLADYKKRIEYEKSIIAKGGFEDYFVILKDANDYADKEGIMRGLGRGSAAGSLISYLLDIVKIDPLKYGLIFERFLNESRIMKEIDDGNGGKKWIAGSPPDIDGDFESLGREKIKKYFIKKYGKNQVCFIGTYGLIHIKSAIKELAKLKGIPFQEVNYITGTLPFRDEPKSFFDLVKYSSETPILKKFLKDYTVEISNNIDLINTAIKSVSIHAAGVVITPEYDEEGERKEIYDWFPVRKDKTGVLVSEYDGVELDSMGFLKNDILGIKQADKIKDIFHLIKKEKGIDFSYEDIPLDDEKTFLYFSEGFCQDVFQFNGSGMNSFLIEMMPNNIEDLIAANALYRPGSMNSGLHKVYVKVKNGEKIPEYLWGLEEITKSTYSTLPYQEQILETARKVANFNLSEADNLRRAIGKRDKEKMLSYEEMFKQKAISNGCPKDQADKIWRIILDNADYSFNKSHSAAYAITGYITMFLKAHYPVEFYTVSLKYSDDKSRPRILSEMNALKEAKILPPDINNSSLEFKPDFLNNKIYWSLASVKWVGDKAVEKIIQNRELNGDFFSLQEFYERVNKRTVNKRAIQNLILSGAFDSIYEIRSESERLIILKDFFEGILKESLPEEFTFYSNIIKNHWWVLKAKSITGLGHIDYQEALPSSFEKSQLFNPLTFNEESKRGTKTVVGGVPISVIERDSKKGKFLTMDLDHNSQIVNVLIWNDQYKPIKKLLKKADDKLVFLSGIIKFDSFKGVNGLQSYEDTKIEII